MFRNFGSHISGGAFDDATIEAVWHKARIAPPNDPNQFRLDACGAWIGRAAYGTTTTYGWEVDHVRPVSKGGSDDLSNLQPLQWENNRNKGDDFPNWSCKVRAA